MAALSRGDASARGKKGGRCCLVHSGVEEEVGALVVDTFGVGALCVAYCLSELPSCLVGVRGNRLDARISHGASPGRRSAA